MWDELVSRWLVCCLCMLVTIRYALSNSIRQWKVQLERLLAVDQSNRIVVILSTALQKQVGGRYVGNAPFVLRNGNSGDYVVPILLHVAKGSFRLLAKP